VTKIMTDWISEPFSLILFDHHTDMQPPMIDGMISCGDWARSVLLTNPNLQQLILIGPKKADIQAVFSDKQLKAREKKILKEKLIAFSTEELRAEEGHEKAEKIFTFLDDKENLKKLVASSDADGIEAKIGKENDFEILQDCSLVTINYSLGNKKAGKIGVIGPKRMNYSKVFASLDLISNEIDKILNEYISDE